MHEHDVVLHTMLYPALYKDLLVTSYICNICNLFLGIILYAELEITNKIYRSLIFGKIYCIMKGGYFNKNICHKTIVSIYLANAANGF